MLHGDIGLGRKIPLAFMGDGMSRLLSAIIYIATNDGGILLIDEFESGLHYSVVPKVWRAIAAAGRKFNCQIVASTHSYECLTAAQSGLNGDYENDFTFVRLDRHKNKVTAKSLDYALFTAALESNVELR
jgi:predicted ATP-dependent endonuclease of OLD family